MSNEVTITQMNEVIAEFMGLEKEEEMYYTARYRKIYLVNGYWLPIKKLKYHTSWDWLMPVVAELKERFKETNKTNPVQTQMHNEGINFQLRIVNIASTHLAVFHAIRWYNQQKQTNDTTGTNKG